MTSTSEQACITLRRWIDHGLTPTPISVNMSRMHIHDPRLREKLVDLVKRYGLPPHLLELELYGKRLPRKRERPFRVHERPPALRLPVLDGRFGSGYSSLNMLKSMPVDFIKIDRGFLNEVVATDRGKTVIRFSISLAKEMNIRVIAEGVENEEQAAFLLRSGLLLRTGLFLLPAPARPGLRGPRLRLNATALPDCAAHPPDCGEEAFGGEIQSF
ncbi:MAG: EAL domain-containing protein [Bilophila sp.]